MSRFRRASSWILIAFASALVLSGCSAVRPSKQDVSTLEPSPLNKTEKAKLKKVLLGEVQTIYASDVGLARVYGQTANLGKVAYRVLEFEVVAKEKQRGPVGDVENRSVVGVFRVENLQPREVRPFDVQTTADAGSLQKVEVVVRAALR